MEYHPRLIEEKIHHLSDVFPVVVLCGARQAGKSTLMAHVLGGKVPAFVFDPVTDVANAREDPELFLRLNPPPLFLDEVQYAPELLPVLKRIADQSPERSGQYFLTGSQQLEVLTKVKESLAGRAVLIDLWPMSRGERAGSLKAGLLAALYAEAPPKDAYALVNRLRESGPPPLPAGNLLERLFRGGFPRLLHVGIDDVPVWFSSYVRTYVERDVRVLRDVSSPHDFSRFLRLVAAITAQDVNASHLGREIGVTPRTAKAWLDILAASYQVVLLDAYSGNAIKRVSGRPRAHLCDTGLAANLLSVSSPPALGNHRSLGALFETFAVTEILKTAEALTLKPQAWHWRTLAGAEVDLLLERDGVFVPIEVKLSSRPSRRDLSGLHAFVETYPKLDIGPRIVVHGGSELFLVDESTAAVPVDWV